MRSPQGVPLPMRPEPMPHDVTVAGPAHGGQRRTGPTATAPAIRRTHAVSVPAPVPHLKRSLRRFDIMAMGVAAVISFDVIGQIAAGGGQAVTWIAVLAVTFLLP